MPKLTATDIKKHLLSKIEDTTLARTVADTLAAFDGKDVSKRMTTAVQKAIGDTYSARWSTEYDMYHVKIDRRNAGPHFGYDPDFYFSFLVGYASQGKTYNHAKAIEHNACYLSAADERNARRIEQAEDTANLTAIASAINAHNMAIRQLRTLLAYPFEERISLASLLEGPASEKGIG